jgi:anti-sigma B factor antagonist
MTFADRSSSRAALGAQPVGIVWPGPQRTRPTPWTGHRVRGRGKTKGLRVDIGQGDQPTVAIAGEIDLYSAAELRDELLRVLRRHGRRLTLDLREVTFMDSAGIEVLLATRRRAQLENGWVRVSEASPCAWRMITLTGLRQEFTAPQES